MEMETPTIHVLISSTTPMDQQNLPDSFSALSIGESVDPNWYLDSGASAHMTSDLGILTHPKPYQNKQKVVVGNGNLLPMSIVSTFYLKTSHSPLKLSYVFHVPNLFRNLLSTKRLFI